MKLVIELSSCGNGEAFSFKARCLDPDPFASVEETAAFLAACKRLFAGAEICVGQNMTEDHLRTPLSSFASANPPTPIHAQMTAKEAAKRFIESICLRRDAKQVSHYYYLGMQQRVMHGIRYLGEDKRLAEIGEQDLTQMVLKIVARPQVKRTNNDAHPMSLIYGHRMLGALKTFFVWCYETELWNNRPRRFDRLFRFKPVLTEAEKEARLIGNTVEPSHFSIEELTKLYASCSDRHRLWLLLCLNCGYLQLGRSSGLEGVRGARVQLMAL